MDKGRIKYLESRLTEPEEIYENKYRSGFEKYATYMGNGVYQWSGVIATCTRELWLMGVLHRERIDYKQV